MRPVHFNDLSLRDKTLLIDDFGVMLCSIEYYDHRVYLYSLNGLFVEAYHNIDSRMIDRVTMAEPADLDKFLSRISIYNYKKREDHQY